MAVLSLPLSFTNSFWSQDYRRGLHVLFQKLDQGIAENDEIVAFIRARATAEGHLADTLSNPPLTGRAGTGFGADDGASLLMAFRGLQAESVAQGQAHKSIANELTTLVADPFEEWAVGYKERLRLNKTTVIDNWLRSYEQARGEVAKLKHQYLAKTRRADEAEDDAKFAPNSDGISDKFTTSPRLRPLDGRAVPQRGASVSERIAARLKDIQKRSVDALSAATTTTEDPNAYPEVIFEKHVSVDKGKGKAVDDVPEIASPPPMSPALPPKVDIPPSSSPVPPMAPPPMLLAGLSLPPIAVSQLLTRAAAELPLRPVRFPLLGEYQDAFTGEEFVAWLNENVQGFGGSLDRAEDAARELTERENLLRRLGELGNQFEHSDDAFYQFRPKAFDLEGKGTDLKVSSPIKAIQSETLVKRTGAFVNLVSKALNTNPSGEPAYLKARHEAEEADRAYRIAVRKLDRHRLGLEERIEEVLKLLQKWETERLRAVKTVLLQYQGTLANLPKSVEPSLERSATLIAAYQPESDLTALIERYRTGPFRPDPQVYESVAHDESDVLFGIDLRKWAEGGWYALTSGAEKKETIPPVLTALLAALDEAYARLPSPAEKRKAWIYEVPLPAVHHLRESLNALPPDQPIPADLFARYDAPVIASAIKLWLLELNPPLALYEGWEDFRRLYPSVGSQKTEGEESEEQRLQNLGTALQRLPRVHLYVLDVVTKHLKGLIASTKNEDESDEVYVTKLALSIGRTIIRPKVESEISIQDRHSTLLFIDLLKNYDALLPPTIERKKRESERKVPIRKRTAPVDMRLSRSRMSIGADPKQLLVAQHVAQNPSMAKGTKSPELTVKSPEQVTLVAPPPPPPIHASHPQKPITPPPPPTHEKLKAPPPPPASVVAAHAAPALVPPPPPPPVHSNLPPRPSFKEPPPEDDTLPPRPSFKEPPAETDDDELSPPPRPTFAEPPAEEESSTPTPPLPPPSTTVIPPTPQKQPSAASPSPTKIGSRSPSPPSSSGATSPNQDVVLGSGRTSISRSGSAQSQTTTRGPRIARGPRAPGSGSVQNLVQNLNKRESTGVSPPSPASPVAKRINRLSGSPVRRPSSVLGRSSPFSRRTMASDAEDDVVDRK